VRKVSYVPLPINAPLVTSSAGATVGGVVGSGLPDGLPGLGRGLDVDSGGGINSRTANHHAGRLANGRVVVGHTASSGPHERSIILDLVARDDVHQEVENVGTSDSSGDVVLLESAALVLLGVEPGADGELEDEELAGLGEEDWGLRGDHADVLVSLHDLLDASEGKLVILEVIDMLDLLALVGPEHLQLLLLLVEEVLERRRRCTCTCTSGRRAGVGSGLSLASLLVVLHCPNSENSHLVFLCLSVV